MGVFSTWLWPIVFWAAVLPAWLVFDWFCRPELKRVFGGGARFLGASAVWHCPAWLAVLIVMAPPTTPHAWTSLFWRLPLAVGAAALLAWVLRRAPGTAPLYRDYGHAERRVRALVG
jgi:hypothetical protein